MKTVPVPVAHIEQALRLIDDMSRFIGQMALQDYAAFNEVPMNLRSALRDAGITTTAGAGS